MARNVGAARKLNTSTATKVSATTASQQPPSAGAVTLSWQVTPPLLEVKNPPLAVSQNSIRLSGVARDGEQVIDAYIVVSNRVSKIEHRKVFYRSNRNGSLAKEMQFDANVPLWPGVNVVTVVARQSGQVMSSQTLIVNRLGKEGVPGFAALGPFS